MAITPLKNTTPVVQVKPIDCKECNGFGVVKRHPSTEYLDIFPNGDKSGEIVCEICDGHGKIYPEDEDE